MATLYEAVDEGALPIRLPAFVRKELEGFLDCGLLFRGFAHVQYLGGTRSLRRMGGSV